MEARFVPMMHPTEERRLFVAEKSTFNSLADFPRTESYRGLALGNAPAKRWGLIVRRRWNVLSVGS